MTSTGAAWIIRESASCARKRNSRRRSPPFSKKCGYFEDYQFRTGAEYSFLRFPGDSAAYCVYHDNGGLSPWRGWKEHMREYMWTNFRVKVFGGSDSGRFDSRARRAEDNEHYCGADYFSIRKIGKNWENEEVTDSLPGFRKNVVRNPDGSIAAVDGALMELLNKAAYRRGLDLDADGLFHLAMLANAFHAYWHEAFVLLHMAAGRGHAAAAEALRMA